MNFKILTSYDYSLKDIIKDAFDIEIENIDMKKCLDNNIRFLCSYIDAKLVGLVMITKKYDPIKNIYSYYLDYVSVLKEYQNKGIGTKLIEEVENIARTENISYIEFTSSSKRIYARKMYLKLGYNLKDTGVFIKNL